MTDEPPFVSIIIPTRPGQENILAVAAARALDYPKDRLEILVARGKQPAVQRNHALRAAQGGIVFFLDDDARPRPDSLRMALRHFREPSVQMVGGPNLCPADAPALEQVFAVVLASWLAFVSSRARYAAVGQVRATSEKELILCNMLARRTALLEAGGFDEALYPNEENALMDELQRRGGRLIYDPQLIAHRRPRPTLRAFLKMLMTYGRGRAEQLRLHPTPGSALNCVPPLFCLYLLALPLLPWLFEWRWVPFLPLAVYLAAVLGQTLVSMAAHGIGRALLAAPLVAATHILYGCGFWRGLFTRVKAKGTGPKSDVQLDRFAVET